MARDSKYGIPSLKRDFPSEESCISFIFEALHSKDCSCGGTYHLIKGRKQFQCSKCRFQIAPMAGTIFEKTSTPLDLWFQAILVFSNAKSGVSAKEIERQLEVTYKCAYRILRQIKTALAHQGRLLRGDVEIDVGFFGGRRSMGNKGGFSRNKLMDKKSIVIAAIERKGNIKASVIPSESTEHITDFIRANVDSSGTRLLTDGSAKFQGVKEYAREFVSHRRKEYVRGDVYVNSVETFFAHLKRSLKGTYKSISKEHFQEYLDAFVFHRNTRYNDRQRFAALLDTLLQPVG